MEAKGRTVHLLVAALIGFAVLAGSSSAYSEGWLFGVRPGTTVESAYFGASLGSVNPIVGVDFFSVGVNIEGFEASASMYIPHFGARFYFNQNRTQGNISPYVQGTFLKSFASIKLDELGSEIEDMIGDLLSFWGISLAFGAEYFFSDHFSVGGEYGLRYIKDSAELDIDTNILDEPVVIQSDLEITYKASYAVASLNFHF